MIVNYDSRASSVSDAPNCSITYDHIGRESAINRVLDGSTCPG